MKLLNSGSGEEISEGLDRDRLNVVGSCCCMCMSPCSLYSLC
uniref:Uncharacterized protein n=1 Tax=Arundo donax TaxID=35708 RepID=A0A0A8ZHX6_ARUDO